MCVPNFVKELLSAVIKILESCRSFNHYFFESFVIQYSQDNQWLELDGDTKMSSFDDPTFIRVIEEVRDLSKHEEETNGKDKDKKDKDKKDKDKKDKGKDKKKDKDKKKKGKGDDKKDDEKGNEDNDDKGKDIEKKDTAIVPITMRGRYREFLENPSCSHHCREKIQYIGINLKQASQLPQPDAKDAKQQAQLNPYVIFSWLSSPDERWRSLTKTSTHFPFKKKNMNESLLPLLTPPVDSPEPKFWENFILPIPEDHITDLQIDDSLEVTIMNLNKSGGSDALLGKASVIFFLEIHTNSSQIPLSSLFPTKKAEPVQIKTDKGCLIDVELTWFDDTTPLASPTDKQGYKRSILLSSFKKCM